MPNLTPSEIAEIQTKTNEYKQSLAKGFNERDRNLVTAGYLTAKLEDAAEIKRLREGIEK